MRLIHKIAKVRVQLPIIRLENSAAFSTLLEPIDDELNAFSFRRVFVKQIKNALNEDFLDQF